MLDENFPTYRLQTSSEDPLQTTLYFTFNGSDPTREYILKRPQPSNSQNQYALALFDAHNSSVIYGEVLVQPKWEQPTLSAAEIRANNGPVPNIPVLPESFSVMLYNPDQEIIVRRNQGGWNKPDTWGFEIPERTFKLPSASKLDLETGSNQLSEQSEKIVFHWKKDGRLSKDMTCFLSGRTVGGRKNRDPDITVAMFKGRKHEDILSIYEPNMARVEVEDRKGLEVVLLLSAIVTQDLYLNPKQDPFNIGGSTGAATNGRRKNSRPTGPQPDLAVVSGALGNVTPPPPGLPPGKSARQAEIDAETRRLQAMVAEEERQMRSRKAREEEEQTRRLLEREEQEQRRRKQAEVDAETDRLRRQYGVQAPALPPRHNQPMPSMSGAINHSGWYGSPGGSLQPPMPPRPHSVSPPGTYAQQQPYGQSPPMPPRPGNPPSGPYAGPSGAGASVANFFGVNRNEDDKKRKKVKKKLSVHF